MAMSKVREDVKIIEGELESPAEGDLRAYVIFTQLKKGGPYIYAGWVDAVDEAMAIQFACEHYGQDQECVCIWAIPRSSIAGTEVEYPASAEVGSSPAFQVFTQKKRGDQHFSAGTIEATSSAAALQQARERFGTEDPNSIWVVPRDQIAATNKDDVIWRHMSQDYRMARGYAADVRDKWEKIRKKRDIEEYEKDDLKEMF